ncbi:MAG: portal protein [Candidatus Onthovivens sp.]|nr:portal protein [Candidatus Onthovivens sp.]
MGFFDKLSRKNESVRIKKNNDDENNLYFNIDKNVDTIRDSNDDLLNMNEINKFRLLKSNRNEKFNSFDLMSQDSRVASILNMYADDCTQYNQSSKIIWAESSDQNCADFVNRLIDNLQLNKHAWSHIYSLCKYGDLYLELFYDEEKINNTNGTNNYFRPNGSTIEERIEMVRNPGSMFDLISQGKTSFYVKVNSNEENYEAISQGMQMYQNSSKPEDNCLYPPDKFIHISLNDAFNRFTNKYILQNTETGKDEEFDIKEGTSILANAFKTWSELNLLEDSVLLNRLSKSAIIRLIQIEVGNTEGEDVQEVLKSLRDKISRSRYFDKTTGDFKNQANPGPLENIIYHATHKGNGAITHSTIGGDVNVKDLADVDYFLEKFAQSFPIPVAYLKQKNDDGGGLSAGTSLTKFDAKYGRTLKRIQSAYISGIIDLINVYAYKKGLSDYMNMFTIKMVSPSAVEDNERDEKLKNHTDMIRDIMQVINDQDEAYNPQTKKKMIAYLAQTLLQDQGLTDILQEDLNENENQPNYSSKENNEEDELI